LVVKALGEPYQPGKRSDAWLKVKKDYVEGLADSLDLVPIGAWWGNGRKAGWFSPWLMAVHDPETGELQSLCRVMSGFSDAFYKEATARFQKKILASPPPYYMTGESCSVWFEASEVWEIRGAELTASPVHQAAVGEIPGERGLAMRFPRFIKIREDKSVEDASTPTLVASMFKQQSNRVVPKPEVGSKSKAEDASASDEEAGRGDEED